MCYQLIKYLRFFESLVEAYHHITLEYYHHNNWRIFYTIMSDNLERRTNPKILKNSIVYEVDFIVHKTLPLYYRWKCLEFARLIY